MRHSAHRGREKQSAGGFWRGTFTGKMDRGIARGERAPAVLRRAASKAINVLKVLANEDRLLLLCQLSQGELCVSELEERLKIHQPTLSQQLGVLRNEGLVATRREGKRIYYSVADPDALQVLQLLYRLYCPKG